MRKFPHKLQLTPGDHKLNKPESTVPEDASSQVTVFLVNWFSRRFLKMFFYSFLCTHLTPSPVTHPTPWEHSLNILNSTLRIHPHKYLLFANVFWEDCFKMSNDFFIAFNYLSLTEGVVLHLKKNPNPSPKDALRKIWLKIGSFWFFPYG